jgi:hypothetical protein
MIDNHDENSGTERSVKKYGDGEKAFAVFSYAAYGVPMLYSGQEAGLNKRLKFFEKDTISGMTPIKYFDFYQKLNKLKEIMSRYGTDIMVACRKDRRRETRMSFRLSVQRMETL